MACLRGGAGWDVSLCAAANLRSVAGIAKVKRLLASERRPKRRPSFWLKDNPSFSRPVAWRNLNWPSIAVYSDKFAKTLVG